MAAVAVKPVEAVPVRRERRLSESGRSIGGPPRKVEVLASTHFIDGA
jgi:hypothetical protein